MKSGSAKQNRKKRDEAKIAVDDEDEYAAFKAFQAMQLKSKEEAKAKTQIQASKKLRKPVEFLKNEEADGK